MTERERLLSVLKGETPDKTPWFGDLSYLYNSFQKRNVLEKKYLGEKGYLRFHQDLGVGICFYAPFPWKSYFSGNITYSEKTKLNKRYHEYNTPIGSLRSIWTYLPEAFTWACTEYFIKTIEDLFTMVYIFENTKYTENYAEYVRIDKIWGDNGIAVAIPPVSVSPLQKLLARWAGVENTINLYFDHINDFDGAISSVQYAENRVFEIIADSPALYIEFAENLSSEVTGKNFFMKYNNEYYSKRIAQLHEAEKFVGIHIDGSLKSCLPLLASCGFDVAEAVTPAPVGDIEIRELRKSAGNGIILWGGLPGALFSPLYSSETFEKHINILLDTFPVGSQFVMGVADQVPPDGLLQRVKRVRELIEDRA